MTRLIFVRHGESQANQLRLFAGSSNFALTEKGVAQAQATAQELKKYKIEVIKSIHDTVNILEKNYGIRDVEQDLGGYVVIAENIVDIEIMKQDKLQV